MWNMWSPELHVIKTVKICNNFHTHSVLASSVLFTFSYTCMGLIPIGHMTVTRACRKPQSSGQLLINKFTRRHKMTQERTTAVTSKLTQFWYPSDELHWASSFIGSRPQCLCCIWDGPTKATFSKVSEVTFSQVYQKNYSLGLSSQRVATCI